MNHQSMRQLTEAQVRQLLAQAMRQGLDASAARLQVELASRLMPSEREPVQQICPYVKN